GRDDMRQHMRIAAFSMVVGGLAVAGPAVQAAPQALGIVASLAPTPMLCTDKGCRADLSAFCLQQQREDPHPGTVYHMAPGTQVTLVVTGHDGQQRRVEAGRYLSFTDDRGFAAITARLTPQALSQLDAASVAIEVGRDATLLPHSVAGDTNPQGEDEVALAA